MHDINYYTNISQHSKQLIEDLSNVELLELMSYTNIELLSRQEFICDQIRFELRNDIDHLNQNEALGLIKAIADRLQHTLISK